MNTTIEKSEFLRKFTLKVLDVLENKYGVSHNSAIDMLENSVYQDLLDADASLVMYYAPSYWADKIYKEAKFVACI